MDILLLNNNTSFMSYFISDTFWAGINKKGNSLRFTMTYIFCPVPWRFFDLEASVTLVTASSSNNTSASVGRATSPLVCQWFRQTASLHQVLPCFLGCLDRRLPFVLPSLLSSWRCLLPLRTPPSQLDRTHCPPTGTRNK